MGNRSGLFAVLFLIVAILTLCTATALAFISFSEDGKQEVVSVKTEKIQEESLPTTPNSKTYVVEQVEEPEKEIPKSTSKTTSSSTSTISASDNEEEFDSEEDNVSNLEDDVEDTEDDLDDIEDDISDAEDDNDIEDIEDALDELDEDVDDIEDEIEDLKDELEDENDDDAEELLERLEDLEDELDELEEDIDAAETALAVKQQEIEGDLDADDDGVLDSADICSGYDDNVDTDSDGTPDGCDSVDNRDSDGDGVNNTNDVCSGYDDSIDTDADGTPDGCDDVDNTDSDGDGVIDSEDVCSGYDDTLDTDGDGTPDGCDDVDNTDSDGDGVLDTSDVCSGYDDTIDSDGDGTPDGCDNEAPTVTTDCTTTATVGIAYSCTATGSDSDGDALIYSVSGVDGITISSSGSISWTPTTSQMGIQTFIVTVTDTRSETGTASVSVSVSGNDIEELLAAIEDAEDTIDDINDEIVDIESQVTDELTRSEILALFEELDALYDEVSDLEDVVYDDFYDDFEDIDDEDFADAGVDQDDVEESLDNLADAVDELYDTLDDLYDELDTLYSLYSYELCNEDLYFGTNISYCEGTVTEDEFGLLDTETYEDSIGSTTNAVTYTQTIAFQSESTGQFIFTQDDDDAPYADAYLFIDNSNNFLYNYSLFFASPVVFDATTEATAESDLVGTTLIVQDAAYEIIGLTLTSGVITELVLEAEAGEQITLVENSEILIDGTAVDGSHSIIDSSAGALNGFSVAFAPDTDEVYLASGDEYLDPVFGKFSIYYDGAYGYFEDMLFISGSTSAELRFYNYDGTYVEIPLAADSSYASGEATDEPIFWGNEAPSSTTANQDELLYLEDETCYGSASVVDCQGAMFLVIDSDGNAHVTQITNIDTNDNEINFDDITYGTSGDNVAYTDGTISDISTDIGTIQLLIDETAKTITFTTIGSTDGAEIITYNEAALEIINTDLTTQTFEGITFSEFNDGIRDIELYLSDLEIRAAYDDATDNRIEWNNAEISSALTSDNGFGFYDYSDENDDYQDFVTYKGTLIETDRLDQTYVYLMHPYEAVYAIVSLEAN